MTRHCVTLALTLVTVSTASNAQEHNRDYSDGKRVQFVEIGILSEHEAQQHDRRLPVRGLRTLGSTCQPSLQFAYDVVGTVGDLGITDFQTDVSISERGAVTAIGWLTDGQTSWENIFAWRPWAGTLTNISTSITSQYSPVVGPPVQVNAQNRALVRRFITILNAPITYIETWGIDSNNDRSTIVYGEPLFGTFDGLYPNPSINNGGGVVFAALDEGTNYLGTVTSDGNFIVELSAELPDPLIADNNHFVMRIGTTRIAVLPPAFFPFVTIANTPQFDAVGKRAGINNAGNRVAFYGDLSGTGAAEYGLDPGPGIFVGTISGGSVSIARVEGANIDPSGFITDGRISISDDVDDSFVVSYVGRENGGPKTLFSVFVEDEGGGSFVVEGPITVASVGGAIEGATINDLAPAYDGIALAATGDGGEPRAPAEREHRVAFWADTSAGERVYRGSYTGQTTVARDGGVRARVIVPPGTPLDVRIWFDADTDGTVNGGEVTVDGMHLAVHQGASADTIFFTPPPYNDAWPNFTDSQFISVAVGPPGNHLSYCNYLEYVDEALSKLSATQDGLLTAVGEAVALSSALQTDAAMILAGSIAEMVVYSIFQNMDADDAAKPGLVERMESMLPAIRDEMRKAVGGGQDKIIVRPITHGQTSHTEYDDIDDVIYMTLATGTLARTSDVSFEDHDPTGGTILVPHLMASAQSVMLNDWRFTYDCDAAIGLRLRDLEISRGLLGSFERVADELSIPSIILDGGSYRDVRRADLSHVYVNPSILAELPPEGGVAPRHSGGETRREWMLSGAFRINVDGSGSEGNDPAIAISGRQTFGLTEKYDSVEPSHCVRGGGVYPRVTFTVSLPHTAEGDSPGSIRVDHKLALNPENGGDFGEHIPGLFRDNDSNTMFTVDTRLADPPCQPLPFWVNIFECFDASQVTAPLETASIYVIDAESNESIPDNMHYHALHERWWCNGLLGLLLRGAWPIAVTAACLITDDNGVEAPGSFDGTIHMHWRWSEVFGSSFGDGKLLFPENQTWVVGATPAAGVPADFDRLEDVVATGTPINREKTTVLVGCEQSDVEANRQYETLSTGFAVADGTPLNSCLVFRAIIETFGYQIISARFCGRTNRIIDEIDFIAILNVLRNRSSIRSTIFRAIADVIADNALGLDCVVAPRGSAASARSSDPCFNFWPSDSLYQRTTPFSFAGTDPTTVFDVSAVDAGDTCIVIPSFLEPQSGFMIAGIDETDAVRIDVSTPVYEVWNLQVAVDDGGAGGTVEARLLDGETEVAAFTVATVAALGGAISQGRVSASLPMSFDAIELRTTGGEPIAIGNGLLCTEETIVADLNLDGVVDVADWELIEMCFDAGLHGSCADFDITGDGLVDCEDVEAVDIAAGGLGLLEDCNENGTFDGCDIGSGVSADINRNRIPDECEGVVDSSPEVSIGPFAVFGPRPNPARSTTTITVQMPDAGRVEIRIFDVSGRAVATIFEGSVDAGIHPFTWDMRRSGAAVSAGRYFVRTRALGQVNVQSIVVM